MPDPAIPQPSAEDAALRQVLEDFGLLICPGCKREIDRGDCAWNGGSTEYGTPWSSLEIHCQGCDTEVLSANSWAEIESFEDFVAELPDVLEHNQGRKR